MLVLQETQQRAAPTLIDDLLLIEAQEVALGLPAPISDRLFDIVWKST